MELSRPSAITIHLTFSPPFSPLPPIFHYRRFDGTESLFSSRLADYLGSIA